MSAAGGLGPARFPGARPPPTSSPGLFGLLPGVPSLSSALVPGHAAAKQKVYEANRFMADTDEGKLMRLGKKFDDAIAGPTYNALQQLKLVAIQFPIRTGAEAYPTATAVIKAAAPDIVDMAVNPDLVPPPPTTQPAAERAADKVTKKELINILLRLPTVKTLFRTLQAVTFDTRVGDTPTTQNPAGSLNLKLNAQPYAGEQGLARFKELLACCYGERMVQACISPQVEVGRAAAYAYMENIGEIPEACRTTLLNRFIADFPVQDLCSDLEAAVTAQAAAAPGAAAGGGGGSSAQAGGRRTRNRKGRKGKARYTRRY